ncbi:MAG: hypothetical protein EOP83_01290 [Verrucomicrobiaceae bacterium]|nr:MAG: hypothetical protein EOP83_01290 [Verrucomicrobiaceae bacterium]
MKTKDENSKDARNEDAITGEPGSHPVGVGVGTTAGAAAGGAMGAVAGPVGAVVGAVVGGIAGGLAGKSVAESIDPTVEDAYWRENHAAQSYARPDRTYDDYASAYRAGYSSPQGESFEASEAPIRARWESQSTGLSWDDARPAARASWERVQQRVNPAGADVVKIGV